MLAQMSRSPRGVSRFALELAEVLIDLDAVRFVRQMLGDFHSRVTLRGQSPGPP